MQTQPDDDVCMCAQRNLRINECKAEAKCYEKGERGQRSVCMWCIDGYAASTMNATDASALRVLSERRSVELGENDGSCRQAHDGDRDKVDEQSSSSGWAVAVSGARRARAGARAASRTRRRAAVQTAGWLSRVRSIADGCSVGAGSWSYVARTSGHWASAVEGSVLWLAWEQVVVGPVGRERRRMLPVARIFDE